AAATPPTAAGSRRRRCTRSATAASPATMPRPWSWQAPSSSRHRPASHSPSGERDALVDFAGGCRQRALGHLLLEIGQPLLLIGGAVRLPAERDELVADMAGPDMGERRAAAIGHVEHIALEHLAALGLGERRIDGVAAVGDAARHHLEA